MKLTEERKKATGAFYTPKEWAELAVKYISYEVGDLKDYLFYDPACGEGSLLEALPNEVEKFGTTLESEDVRICREKGFKVCQMDFLDYKEPFGLEHHFKGIDRSKIIVFTNPPYFKLKTDQYQEIKERYSTNDSVALFYSRILSELCPSLLCGFNKMDIYQSQQLKNFRTEYDLFNSVKSGFLTSSKTWGLKGRFPIVFNIIGNFFNGRGDGQKFTFDIFEDIPKTKTIHNL